MPTEYQTAAVMRCKATNYDPKTRKLTLTLEQFESSLETAELLGGLVIEGQSVDVVMSREVVRG